MRIFTLIIFVLVWGCNGCSDHQHHAQTNDKAQLEKDLIEFNKSLHNEETKRIKAFILDKKWPMVETSTGLQYWIYELGSGENAKNEQIAEISYTVQLLDGKEVYSADEKNPGSFRIGRDNVESGLHELILLMKLGDRAKVILPSHLAFGLTGDSEKIPQSTTLVYDIKLLSLK